MSGHLQLVSDFATSRGQGQDVRISIQDIHQRAGRGEAGTRGRAVQERNDRQVIGTWYAGLSHNGLKIKYRLNLQREVRGVIPSGEAVFQLQPLPVQPGPPRSPRHGAWIRDAV